MIADPIEPPRAADPMPPDDLLAAIEHKRAALAALRARLPGRRLTNFEHSIDLELTYTSNAIEGNTLTAAETTLVIEQGITVAGKPLRDHMEAIDHIAALAYVRDLARRALPVIELDVRSLHRLMMLRSAPDAAGQYADQGRYVLTEAGRHTFPSPAEIPALMGQFVQDLTQAGDRPGTALDAHRRLVAIHPFNDGNGRTARLLMNLLLIRAGYPPIAVRPQDRPAYIAALQQSQSRHVGGPDSFNWLLYQRIDETLLDYLNAAADAAVAP